MASKRIWTAMVCMVMGLLASACGGEEAIEVNAVFKADMVFAEVAMDQICLAQGEAQLSCEPLMDVTLERTTSHAVELGDVDGDGDLDAVFVSDVVRADDDHMTCLNTGNGEFECNTFFADGHFSESLALGDMDGDGDLDVVLSTRVVDNNRGTRLDQNRVCLGDGRGRFGCQRLSEDLTSSRGVAVADMNADGIPDAIFANDAENSICFGQGSATFQCQPVSADTVTSNAVAIGDVDKDGRLDIVFANSRQNHVCLQKSPLVFDCKEIENNEDHSADVALADFNGDGHLDAVFANDWRQIGQSPAKFQYGVPNRICLGNDKGSFNCRNLSEDEGYSSGLGVGDVNEDGHLDVVFANFRAKNTAALGQKNHACFGNGKGRFLCVEVNANFNFSFDVAIGNLDGQ